MTGRPLQERSELGGHRKVRSPDAAVVTTTKRRAFAAFDLALLDGFDISRKDRPIVLNPPAQRLVAYLALEPRRRCRERIGAILWPDLDRRRAAANVRRALFNVQQMAGGLIDVDGPLLTLAQGTRVDVRELGLIDAGVVHGIPAPEDLGRLHCELLADWPDTWLVDIREVIHAVRLRRLEHWAGELLADGCYQDGLHAASVAVRIDPLRESAQRLVIRAHLAAGNHADAIRQYQAYKDVLWETLGLRPGFDMNQVLESGIDSACACWRLRRA